MAELGSNVHLIGVKSVGAAPVAVSFIEVSLNAGSVVSAQLKNAIAKAAVNGSMSREDDEAWAKLSSFSKRGASPEPKPAGDIVCGSHHARANGNWLPAQARISKLFHRGKEGIDVDVEHTGRHDSD